MWTIRIWCWISTEVRIPLCMVVSTQLIHEGLALLYRRAIYILYQYIHAYVCVCVSTLLYTIVLHASSLASDTIFACVAIMKLTNWNMDFELCISIVCISCMILSIYLHMNPHNGNCGCKLIMKHSTYFALNVVFYNSHTNFLSGFIYVECYTNTISSLQINFTCPTSLEANILLLLNCLQLIFFMCMIYFNLKTERLHCLSSKQHIDIQVLGRVTFTCIGNICIYFIKHQL